MKTLYLLFIAIFLVLSCKKEEVKPNQLLRNTNVESSLTAESYWWNNGTGLSFSAVLTDEYSFSPTHSLKLLRTKSDQTNFWYWVQEYTGEMPYGKDLTLTAKIKGVDLQGEGLSIAIRCDNTNGGSQFATTEGTVSITGNFDWTSYNVKLTDVYTNVNKIYVFLVFLPNTTGVAYFDDITLTYQ